MHTLAELETPTAVVDLDRMTRNLDRVAKYAAEHDLALRPHIKTHKSPRVAAEQLRRGAVGVACATPFEAEVMSGVCNDVLIAYPPVGAQRARRIMSLPSSVRIVISLDSIRAAEDLAAAARAADRPASVLVELDLGMHRVGLQDATQAIAVARAVRASPPLLFAGLAFYPGQIRERVEQQDEQIARVAAGLQTAVAAFAAAGLEPPVVSGGSTPTLWRTHEVPDVTEFRPGTYVFNDRSTAAIGACDWDDCALSVLATVVSTAVPGQAVIDAGSKALGREPLRGADQSGGFGSLLEDPDVVVMTMSEEHGILDFSRSAWRPRLGERVRVVPNHVCIAVHLCDIVYGVRGDAVESSWPVAARGRGYAPVIA